MTSEASAQQDVRLEASRLGLRLWRNNSGACYDDRGRLIRYGLGNDSAQVNKRMKSSDLVGFTSVTITPDMVGHTVAVFTAVEMKHPNWSHHKTLDEREIAQKAFHDIVRGGGGYAGFATSVHDFRKIIGIDRVDEL